MEIKQLRLPQAPRKIKIGITLMFACHVLVGIACIGLAISLPASEHSSLIQAAAYALGIGAPFLAVALLVVTAQGGTSAIEQRTKELLAKEIPKRLQQIRLSDTDPASLVKPFPIGKISDVIQEKPNDVMVDVGINSLGVTAHYRIQSSKSNNFQWWVTVDIKPTQATVCLHIPESIFTPNCCPSTLQGARESGGYKIDEEVRSDVIDAQQMKTIILRRHFPDDDLLWDSTKSYEYTVDLMLMLRSFIVELSGIRS